MGLLFPEGGQFTVEVSEDWDGTQAGIANAGWTEVDGMSEYTRGNQANTADHFFFGRSSAVTTTGIPARTITLNGFFSTDDAGQGILRAHAPGGADAGEVLGVRIRPDGVSGYAVQVKVGGGEERANAQGGLQPLSFTLAPQADPVDEA